MAGADPRAGLTFSGAISGAFSGAIGSVSGSKTPLGPRPRRAFLAHGEEGSRSAFAPAARGAFGVRVERPTTGESFSFAEPGIS